MRRFESDGAHGNGGDGASVAMSGGADHQPRVALDSSDDDRSSYAMVELQPASGDEGARGASDNDASTSVGGDGSVGDGGGGGGDSLTSSRTSTLTADGGGGGATRQRCTPRCVRTALISRRCGFLTCMLLLAVINALAIAFLVSFVFYVRGFSLPSLGGSLALPRLRSAVQIEHDADGVIHIDAANEHDLFYAQGAVAAQHRLWQMEFYRRVAAGRLSAIVGNNTLAIDRHFRVLVRLRVARVLFALSRRSNRARGRRRRVCGAPRKPCSTSSCCRTRR